jgi:hypothetical protein
MQTLAMAADYCVVKIEGVNVYAPVGTPQAKLTKDHVVFGGKSRKTVKLGLIQSTTHPLFKREDFIRVAPCTHTFATPDTGPAEIPPQVLPDRLVMNNDGYVFPATMSWQEMERNQASMNVTGSFYTKHEPVTELGDGTPVFTFAVKQTQTSVGVGDIGRAGAFGSWNQIFREKTMHVTGTFCMSVSLYLPKLGSGLFHLLQQVKVIIDAIFCNKGQR